jgi:hypothetical protein
MVRRKYTCVGGFYVWLGNREALTSHFTLTFYSHCVRNPSHLCTTITEPSVPQLYLHLADLTWDYNLAGLKGNHKVVVPLKNVSGNKFRENLIGQSYV